MIPVLTTCPMNEAPVRGLHDGRRPWSITVGGDQGQFSRFVVRWLDTAWMCDGNFLTFALDTKRRPAAVLHKGLVCTRGDSDPGSSASSWSGSSRCRRT